MLKTSSAVPLACRLPAQHLVRRGNEMARDSGKGITYPMRACSQAFARMRCAIFIDFEAASEAHFCSPCSMAPAASLNVLLAFATCSGLASSVRPPSLCCFHDAGDACRDIRQFETAWCADHTAGMMLGLPLSCLQLETRTIVQLMLAPGRDSSTTTEGPHDLHARARQRDQYLERNPHTCSKCNRSARASARWSSQP